MICIGNVEFKTAKSAGYSGNAGWYDWQKNRVKIRYKVLYIPNAVPNMRNFAERCKNAITMTKMFLGTHDSSKMSNASGLFWLPGAQHTNPPDNWQVKLNHVFEIYVSQANYESEDWEEVCSSDLVGGAIRYEGG